MTPEEKSLLERTYKLAEENNEILRSIRRSNRLSIALKVLYWVVILIVGFGAFYFIQPYVEGLLGVYDQLRTTETEVSPWGQSIETLRSLLQ